MKLKKYNTIISETPDDVKEHIRFSMDIMDRIHHLLDKKFDGKQKLLADKMGKTEPEISGWLSGVQNFTIKTLVKLQIAFGEPIIGVCTNEEDEDSTFEQIKLPYKKNKISLVIDCEGAIKPHQVSYSKFRPTNQSIKTEDAL